MSCKELPAARHELGSLLPELAAVQPGLLRELAPLLPGSWPVLAELCRELGQHSTAASRPAAS